MDTWDDPRDPWHAEAEAFAEHQDGGDWDVAASAELPTELQHHALAAELDPGFEDAFSEWLDYLVDADEHTLMLAIEQSCNDGVLLPWGMRAVRLESLPAHTLARLHWLLGACPRHVLVHLVLYVYWLMRSERARRRGSPEWSPSLPLWPEPEWEKEPPAFKPMRSRPRL